MLEGRGTVAKLHTVPVPTVDCHTISSRKEGLGLQFPDGLGTALGLGLQFWERRGTGLGSELQSSAEARDWPRMRTRYQYDNHEMRASHRKDVPYGLFWLPCREASVTCPI